MAHKHGITGRILAGVMALAMIVTSVPEAALTVRAAELGEDVEPVAGAGKTSEAEWEESSDLEKEDAESASEEAIEEGQAPEATSLDEIAVELPEVEEAGDSFADAVELQVGTATQTVALAAGTSMYYKADFAEGKWYFLMVDSVSDSDEYTVSFYRDETTGFGRDAITVKAPYTRGKCHLIGGAKSSGTVTVKVDAGSEAVTGYSLTLYEAELIPSLEREADRWGYTVTAAVQWTGAAPDAEKICKDRYSGEEDEENLLCGCSVECRYSYTDAFGVERNNITAELVYDLGESASASYCFYPRESAGKSGEALITDYKAGDDLAVTVSFGMEKYATGEVIYSDDAVVIESKEQTENTTLAEWTPGAITSDKEYSYIALPDQYHPVRAILKVLNQQRDPDGDFVLIGDTADAGEAACNVAFSVAADDEYENSVALSMIKISKNAGILEGEPYKLDLFVDGVRLEQENVLFGEKENAAAIEIEEDGRVATDAEGMSDGAGIKTDGDGTEMEEDEDKIPVEVRSISAKPGVTSATISASLIGMDNKSYLVYVNVFWREKTEGDVNPWNKSESGRKWVSGDSKKVACHALISGLTSEKTYEYKAVVSSYDLESPDSTAGVIGSKEGTFTTWKETRVLDEVSVLEGITSASFMTSFSGGYEDVSTYFTVFVKEGDQYRRDADSYEQSDMAEGVVKVTVRNLKAGQLYEYALVMTEEPLYDYNSDTKCIGKIEGTFTTKAEARAIKSVDVKVGYTCAKVLVAFEGGYDGDETYVDIFYRKKGDTEWSSRRMSSEATAGVVEAELYSLEKETTYEYATALWSGYPAGSYQPGDLNESIASKTEINEFTTNAEGRKIGDVKVDAGFTFVKFEVPFSESFEDEPTFATFYYRKSGDGKYARWTTVSAEESQGVLTYDSLYYQALVPDTEYEYIVLVSGRYPDIDVNPEMGPSSSEAKKYDLIDRKIGTFKTQKDQRTVITPTYESTYHSAGVRVGYTGSYDGEMTYISLFYREKENGDYELCDSDWYYDKEFTWTKNFYNLKVGTTYEAVFVISTDDSIYDYSQINETNVLDKVAFEFATQQEDRRLITPVVRESYTALYIATGYEGNRYSDRGWIGTYYRKSGTNEGYTRYTCTSNYTETYKYAVTISGLTPDIGYDYAVVFSENYPESQITGDELDKLRADWVFRGTRITKAAEFEAEAVYREDLSTVGYTAVDVKLTGNSQGNMDSMITAKLTFSSESGSSIVAQVSVKNSNGYSAVLETQSLIPGTKYTISQIDLYAIETIGNGAALQEVFIKTLTREGGFDTFTAKFNTVEKVELPVQDVYLNMNAGTQILSAVVSPATAAQVLKCSVEDETTADVASVYSYVRSGETRIAVEPGRIGEATYKIATFAEPEKTLATFRVHVVDYVLVAISAEGAPADIAQDITIEKGALSPALAVYSRISSEESYTVKVDGTISQESGLNVVSWSEADGKLRGVNIGRSNIVLKINHFPVEANVNVVNPCTGFIVKELIQQKEVDYDDDEGYQAEATDDFPAVIKAGPDYAGLTATIAAGESYAIEGYFHPLSMKLSERRDKLEYKVTAGEDKVRVVNGVIYTGKSTTAYDAEITVLAAKDGTDKPWTEQTSVLKLRVAPKPTIPANVGIAVVNVAKKLADVPLAEKYDGWAWDAQDTELIVPKVAGGSYYDYQKKFKVSYNGDANAVYPVKAKEVQLSVVEALSADPAIRDVYGSGCDSYQGKTVVQLKNTPLVFDVSLIASNLGALKQDYDNLLGDAQYQYELKCNKSDGVQISAYKDAKSVQRVSFTKTGDYEFSTVIKSKSGKVLASSKRTVTVVNEPQVAYIRFSATLNDMEKTPVTLDYVYHGEDDKTEVAQRYIVEDDKKAAKGLIVKALAYDDDDRVISNVELKWKSSDTKVVSVTPEKTTTGSTAIKMVGQGHAVITVTAGDSRGKSVDLIYEYRDKRPRVEKKSVTVNLAYDTNVYQGIDLAYNFGSYLEIVPVYYETIDSIKLYEKETDIWDAQAKGEEVTDFGLKRYSDSLADHRYYVTSKETAKAGTYKLWMVVSTKSGDFAYPLTIKAITKKPTATAKISGRINLFYINRAGQEYVAVTAKNYPSAAPVVSWADGSGSEGNGFTVSELRDNSKTKGSTSYYAVGYANVKVDKGKLADRKVASGVLTVKFPGVRGDGITKNLTIATTYKKPKLATVADASSVAKDVHESRGNFQVYNKTESTKKYKEILFYGNPERDMLWKSYTSAVANIEGMTIYPAGDFYSSYVQYSYNGTKASVKVKMTLDSRYWREPLVVTHTVKCITPEAVLNRNVIVTNSSLDDLYIDDLYMSLTGGVTLSDVEIEGASEKEKTLLDENFINVYSASYGKNKAFLAFNQNAVKASGKSLSTGVYEFYIKPYYKSADGSNKELKKVKLSLKVVDQPAAVKTTAKGGLDIAKRSMHRAYINSKDKQVYVNENVVKVNPKIDNNKLPTDCRVVYKLKGEYADCFDLYWNGGWYIGFSGFYEDEQMDAYVSFNRYLKSKMKIRLSIDCTVQVKGSGGEYYDAYTVSGNAFDVKTSQSSPKVKLVSGNNQVLYAAAEQMLERSIVISVPNKCEIYSISGALDCDKDGKPDIRVYSSDNTWLSGKNRRTEARICVSDMDAVLSSQTGKVLKIPVTIRLRGTDGTVKSATVIVKVKVKK